jgi:hypothetical protein
VISYLLLPAMTTTTNDARVVVKDRFIAARERKHDDQRPVDE